MTTTPLTDEPRIPTAGEGGQIVHLSHDELRETAALSITPRASFNLHWNGTLIQFAAGVPQVVDPDVLAALKKAGAEFDEP